MDYGIEVNSGAALLQISHQSKSTWSDASFQSNASLQSNASSDRNRHGLIPVSLVAPHRTDSKAILYYCTRYWTGRRGKNKEGDCADECRSPAVVNGADWNGGKDLQNDVCTYLASEKYEDGNRYCGEGPSYMMENGFDCRGCAPSNPPASSFHDIVGGDGVYMISLNCHTERFNFAADRLKEVGITPIFFGATEASAPAEDLAHGCFPKGDWQCSSDEKVGEGCDTVEQAISDSHRRAIEVASNRESEWTAILEDDSIPAMAEDPGLWTQRLLSVWSQIPEGTDVVRLGWCSLEDPNHRWSAEPTNMVLADTPDAGGCTHAYVVRKSALPKLSGLFPCCCAVDCCFKFGMEKNGISMVNIDAVGSKEYIASHMTQDWGNAYGIMMQAKDDLPTFRGR